MVDRKRVSVFRVDLRIQKSGHPCLRAFKIELYPSTRASVASALADQRVSERDFRVSARFFQAKDFIRFAHHCVDAEKRCISSV